jgi:hypothetical protein
MRDKHELLTGSLNYHSAMKAALSYAQRAT